LTGRPDTRSLTPSTALLESKPLFSLGISSVETCYRKFIYGYEFEVREIRLFVGNKKADGDGSMKPLLGGKGANPR